MSTVKRIGLVAVALGGAAALLVVWFYASVPAPPTPADRLSSSAPDTSVALPDVRAELLRMRWVDQTIRERFADSLRAGRIDGLSGLVRALRCSVLEGRVDEAHTARLKDLIDQYGWLHAGRVGTEGAAAAFLLAQHADHDRAFQKRVLDSLRQAYQNGQASGQQVALLTDRARVADGEPQVYGTKARIQNGTLRVPPIQDSAQVDQRRARMGLPPLSTYLDSLRSVYQRR